MSTTLQLPTTQPRFHPLAISLATTVAAALLLILANKLLGAAGRAAGLKDACWQLTTVRAAFAAATVTTLISFRKDHLAVLGLLYGLSLALTHASTTILHLPAGLLAATAAGLTAAALRHLVTAQLSRAAPTLQSAPTSATPATPAGPKFLLGRQRHEHPERPQRSRWFQRFQYSRRFRRFLHDLIPLLLPALLPPLAFVAFLSAPSLLTATQKLGLPAALTHWSPDLALRLAAAAITALALTLLLPVRPPDR